MSNKTLNKFGEGTCSVPMFNFQGCPAGFCDERAFGERPPARVITPAIGYPYREDGRYAGYVPGLACPMHGGPRERTFMDGDAWCAVHPDFVNLQESPAGFGATRDEAIAALVRAS